jgi:hypothetical protein
MIGKRTLLKKLVVMTVELRYSRTSKDILETSGT